ncbi:MAG: hypothetical protein ACFFDQ_13050 [Candidatus Thorarchaeota archaeon]
MKIPVRGHSTSWCYHYKMQIILLLCMLFVVGLCGGLVAASQPNSTSIHKESSSSSILLQNSGMHTDRIVNRVYTLDFVPKSESAEWVVEPEDGTIEIYDSNLPTGDIPLCIDQTWLSNWWIIVRVYGGYEALYDGWKFEVTQKGTTWEFIVEQYYHEDGTCCSEDYYYYHLLMPEGVANIYFDANNYPEDDLVLPWELKHDPQYTDLGKEIKIEFTTLSAGFEIPEQQFTISSAHSISVLVGIYLAKL